jgi:AcrR family transcriptional regulator
MRPTRSAASSSAGADQRSSGSPDDRSEMIMGVAARLFRERGYDAVSIRDLGSAMGMSSSTLYHYFENKQDILYAITERFMVDFNSEVMPLANGPGPARDRLSLMIAEHIRFIYRRENDLLISAHFRNVLGDEQRERIVDLMREYRYAVRSVIQDGIREGSFKIEDADLCSRIVLDLTNAERDWYHKDRKYSIDDLAEAYALAALRICNDRRKGTPVLHRPAPHQAAANGHRTA